jgi:hypothetical protein
MSVVHGWSISVDLENSSEAVSEPPRYFSLARRGISEPGERFVNIEIAIPALEAKGRPRTELAESSHSYPGGWHT